MSEKESGSTEDVFRVECAYDERLEKALLTAIFDYQTAEEKKRSRIIAVLFGALTLVGFGLAYLQGGAFTFGHVIIFGTGFFLFTSILFLSQLRKQRDAFVNAELNRWKTFSGDMNKIIFELTEESLSTIDPEVSVTYQWSYFSKCKREGNFLFLHNNAGEVTGISSAILGIVNFERAFQMISRRVKPIEVEEQQSVGSQSNEILDEKIQ